MKRTVLVTVVSALIVFVMSGGLAFAKTAPFKYAFVDTDGDGVYTEGTDVPALVTEYEGDAGYWIGVTIPDSLIDYRTNSTAAVLVVPAKTNVSEGKGEVWIWSPGKIRIEAGAVVHAKTLISVSASALEVGKGAKFTTSVAGEIVIDIGDGGVRLDQARFNTGDLSVYVGVSFGNGSNGALVAQGVTIDSQLVTLGTREGISLTDSTVKFKDTKNAGWDPQAFITTNFNYFGAPGSPYPVDLSGTTLAGPGKDYYLVDVYGSPVNQDGMTLKGNCDLHVWP